MNGRRWGIEGPPLEAYSRITNPERFEPLHPAALAHIERLQKCFDVERVEGYVLDQELKATNLIKSWIEPLSSVPALN